MVPHLSRVEFDVEHSPGGHDSFHLPSLSCFKIYRDRFERAHLAAAAAPGPGARQLAARNGQLDSASEIKSHVSSHVVPVAVLWMLVAIVLSNDSTAKYLQHLFHGCAAAVRGR